MSTNTPVNDNSPFEKIESLRNSFVAYPRIKEISRALERLLIFGNAGAAAGSPARCMLLTGTSGSGKTALLKKFASKHPPYRQDGRLICPVLYVEVPSNCKLGVLAENIMRALEVPEAIALRGTTASKTDRAKHYLREQGVKLVILDEFQHMLKSENQKVIFEAADYVKSLLNEAICPFVLAGTDAAKKVYRENEQLQRRSFGVRELKPFDWYDATDRGSFVHILARHQKSFPVELETPLFSEKMAYRIHAIAKGNLGRAIDFIYALASRAVHEGRQKITVSLMREVADDFRDFANPEWVNPFDVEDADVKPVEVEPVQERVTTLGRRKRQITAADLAA